MTKRIIALITVKNVMEDIINNSSSSSDSEDEVYVKRIKLSDRIPRIRVQNYFEDIAIKYSDADFKTHFRITRNTFAFLLELLYPQLSKKSTRFGQNPLSPEKQLLLAIWIMVTPNSFTCVSDRFGISKASAWRSVTRVVNALNSHLHLFINWPSVGDAKVTSKKIKENHLFPEVIGAIANLAIKITAPTEQSDAYINRNGDHSLQLQVVSDENLKFTHVYCGQIKSVHDMRVFRLSGFVNMLNDTNFPENSHLLGDSSYEISKYIMVPFEDNGHLTDLQIKYNNIHSSASMIAHKSLGLLTRRFRTVLSRLPMTRTDLISRYITACCILHNICILKNDLIDIPILVNIRNNVAVNNIHNMILKKEGIKKRNAIMYSLNN